MIQKKIEACGTTDYVAQYLEDTAVFAAFGCAGQRAGFYLKGHITVEHIHSIMMIVDDMMKELHLIKQTALTQEY